MNKETPPRKKRKPRLVSPESSLAERAQPLSPMTPDQTQIDVEDRRTRLKNIESGLAKLLNALHERVPSAFTPTFSEKAETVRLAIELTRLHGNGDVQTHLPEAAGLLAEAGLALVKERADRAQQKTANEEARISQNVRIFFGDEENDKLMPRGYFFGEAPSPLPEIEGLENDKPPIPLFPSKRAFKDFLSKFTQRTGVEEKPAWDGSQCKALAAQWLEMAEGGRVPCWLYKRWAQYRVDDRRAQTAPGRIAKAEKAAQKRAEKQAMTEPPPSEPAPPGKSKRRQG